MYTECPSCQTYFKITPNQLKAAGGKVRCGNCEEVFSALDSLVDVVPDEVLSQLTASAIIEYSSAQEEALSLALSEPQSSRVAESETAGSEADKFTELPNDIGTGEKITSASTFSPDDAASVSLVEEEKNSLALNTEIDSNPNAKSQSLESTPLVQENEINNDIDAALDGLFDGSTEPLIEDTAPSAETDSVPSQLSAISELSALEELDTPETDKKSEEKQLDVALDEPNEVKPAFETINDTEPTSLSDFERELLSSDNKSALSDESSFDLGDSFLDADIKDNKDRQTKNASALDDIDSQAEDTYVLEELEEKTGRSTGMVAKVIWIIVIMILLMTIIGQFVYVKRQKLVLYPELKTTIESLCMNLNKIYPCEISAAKDVAAIELLKRNVISHPNAKNALLITSTIENKAKFDQPFPELTLTFSDINQKIIAKRKFTPKEYLSKEVNIEAGMKRNVPIKLMLEIVDPGEEAVNFEFNFQ